MITGKEALERLNEKLLRYDEHYDYADIEIIKQDLDRLEKLEKVIEILKRFNFTIYTIKYNDNETEFKIYTDCLLETQELTQEEYDLLKECLNDK